MQTKAKNIYNLYIGHRLSTIIFVALIIALGTLGYFYHEGVLTDKSTALYGGLITSLIAVFIQFLMSWNEHLEIENFKEMGLLKVLPNREGKEKYYYELLRKAEKNLDFFGNTSFSFLYDFGGTNKDAGEKASAILRAMERGVKVRIMVISKESLDPNKIQKFMEAEIKLKALQKLKPDLLQITYLEKAPSFTLVTVDHECIVGGIIHTMNSDVTSAVHALKSSPYLKCYLDHFELSWNEKNGLNNTAG